MEKNDTIIVALHTITSSNDFYVFAYESIPTYLFDRSRCGYYIIQRISRYPDHRRETQAHADYFRPRRIFVVTAVFERFILHALKHEDKLESEREEIIITKSMKNYHFVSFVFSNAPSNGSMIIFCKFREAICLN